MDLIYGHLGPPVYDSNSKKWHFAREPQSKRHVRQLGQLRGVVGCKQHASSKGEIQHLLQGYPDIALAGYSDHLQGLAQVSEAVTDATSRYDSIISDLLAVGNAVDETHGRSAEKIRYKQIVAVASGAAGEVVRLVVLQKEHVGWRNNDHVKLHTQTIEGGEQGWWKGNGSRIQQLVIAGTKKEASTWLAVRYQGAISILNPILQSRTVFPMNEEGPIRGLPASRLNAHHVVTLYMKDVDDRPFVDVSFNPWHSKQFATVDQTGQWHVWSIQAQIKGKGLWTVVEDSRGSLINDDNFQLGTSEPIFDGWIKVLWAGDPDILVVANRRCLAIFDVKANPISLNAPDLALQKSADWILDIQRSPVSPRHIMVVTTSRLFWLDIFPSAGRSTLPDAASILVSWVHFRDPHDTSLSLSILDESSLEDDSRMEDTTMVVLYSRLNDLASVFTFQLSNITDHAISKFDPYVLPLTAFRIRNQNDRLDQLERPRRAHPVPLGPQSCFQTDFSRFSISSAPGGLSYSDEQFEAGILCLQITRIPVVIRHAFESQGVFDEPTEFYLVRILDHDLNISEQLYVQSDTDSHILGSPEVRTRPRFAKTPAIVVDDFIVQDGIADEFDLVDSINISSLSNMVAPNQHGKELGDDDDLVNSIDARTMEITWLIEEMRGKEIVSKILPLEDYLESVRTAVETKLVSNRSGLETLLHLGKADVMVTDVDDAANSLQKLLEAIVWSNPAAANDDNNAVKSHALVSASLTPDISNILGLGLNINLSQVYDSLITTCISFLPSNTPNRVRIATEKQMRTIAAQIFLAAHTIRIYAEFPATGYAIEEDQSTQGLSFDLPVRRKGSISSLSTKGKEAVNGVSDSPPPSSPHSEILNYQLLRPIEPSIPSKRSTRSGTPFHRSTSSTSLPNTDSILTATTQDFREDPSTIRLRNLVQLPPQPLLPTKLSNILSHWTLGADPATYEWENAQRATAPPNSEAIAAKQVKRDKYVKRAKKRAWNSARTKDGITAYTHTEAEISNQPEPKRRIETRSQAAEVISTQIPESSQTGIAGISSQPLTGRFAGGKKGAKLKKGRKKGF